MATKNNPGVYDCYAKADPDEPMFILLGRDKHAAEVVRYWVALKAGVAPLGYLSEITPNKVNELPEKLQQALRCSVELESWARTIGPTDAPGT